MKKIIETTRFGKIEADSDHLIEFKDGMIGFPSLKEYVLVESKTTPLILWLQATGAPEVAFPVMEPWFFNPTYKANLNEADKASIEYNGHSLIKMFCVMTIPSEYEKMTINMKAPVIINIDKALASQIILQEKGYEVRVPAFEAFSRASTAISGAERVTQSAAEVATEDYVAVGLRQRARESIEGAA